MHPHDLPLLQKSETVLSRLANKIRGNQLNGSPLGLGYFGTILGSASHRPANYAADLGNDIGFTSSGLLVIGQNIDFSTYFLVVDIVTMAIALPTLDWLVYFSVTCYFAVFEFKFKDASTATTAAAANTVLFNNVDPLDHL